MKISPNITANRLSAHLDACATITHGEHAGVIGTIAELSRRNPESAWRIALSVDGVKVWADAEHVRKLK